MTIRLGSKWLRYYLDERLECKILNGDGEVYGTADIIKVLYVPFSEIKPEWLIFNYDPSYHTLAGALRGLREIYGNVECDTDVSVVFFTVQ